ncbi:hypothetical protein VB776_16190 [Arcicella sp. DC2W]|uniref:Uncharacterized protein n=1 Tax=Arcicella gelida TaxID=2984195 RepID=A0ABU5S7L9_9BACT|nr:hypothetical protein [Arcicella sp. DC2W]MEA5404473.1 hypothetical protein [Arcicella sp. DC2W]
MTKEIFLKTPVIANKEVKFQGKIFPLIGINFLSETIRLKGQHENITTHFSDCEYLTPKK